MNTRAADQFEFVAQTTCVCGAPLTDSGHDVCRDYRWGTVRFRRCAACATMVQSPRISTESVAAWYNSEAYRNARGGDQGPYLDYYAEESQRQFEARARFRRDLAARLPSHGRVLEVGCATGSLLKIVRDAGHDVVGVELSSSFAEFAAATNGLDLLVGDFNQIDNVGDDFDLIVMLGTVANMPQLPHALERVHALLREGGVFYFNVPLNDTWPARLYGDRYWMYAPSVCNFLSRRGLETALARAGFSSIDSALDRQRPTLAKLAGHLKLHKLHPLIEKAGLATAQLPVALPIPAVRCYWAVKS